MSNAIDIGIIGVGFVGRAICRGFNLFANIKTYDKDSRKCVNTFKDTINSDFVFIALPTPMVSADGGKCNLSIVINFFDSLSDLPVEISSRPIYIIKSTVPVGTTREFSKKYPNLKIVHSPEFLTARSALIDFLTPSRIIIGGDGEKTIKVSELFRERFPGVECLVMSSDESETVKYVANCFLATKVMFFNEMKLFADAANLDWENIIRGVLSDGRIGKSHYQVPGFDGDKGFGGTCFPKDINALIKSMESFNIEPRVLKAVWEQNKSIRKNWDWSTSPSAVSNNE